MIGTLLAHATAAKFPAFRQFVVGVGKALIEVRLSEGARRGEALADALEANGYEPKRRELSGGEGRGE